MKTLHLALAAALLAAAHAHAVTILHNFTGVSTDGDRPYGSLTLSGSKLYGTTGYGGSSAVGTIFSVNTDGSGFGLLHNFIGSFSDGNTPRGSLTISGSKLYGMAGGGSSLYGTIFSVNTDGTGYSQLRNFTGGSTDGDEPYGALTLSGSKLYGMTGYGGSSNSGTIFSINTDGSGFSLLHSFTGGSTDGNEPHGSLTLSGSKLYGMTYLGGSGSKGMLFSVNTDGTGYSLLHDFTGSTTDGSYPVGSLTLIGSKLYGTTQLGGSRNDGTLFSINTDGSGFTLLHSFLSVTDGDQPQSSLILSGSKLYGTSYYGGNSNNRGTVFSINTDGSGYSVVQRFALNGAEGSNIPGDVTLSADGQTLYGMTYQGGTANLGVIFSNPTPEPSTTLLLAGAAFPLLARRRRG